MEKMPVKILVIDDMPANLMVLGAALEGEFALQFATSGPAGIALALANPPELILLDVMMPEVDGFETFRRLAAQPSLIHIPVMFVTGLNDVESEVTGLALGAADYLTKPINIAIARHRIRNLLERERLRHDVQMQRDRLQEEIERRIKSEEQVRQLAFHDTLTGLPNRRMLGDRLTQAMSASKRSGLYGALMFLDLDNFKRLNDLHGHAVGDMLLTEVATRLTGCLRAMDTVARFGGDEFVLLLGELDADKAKSIAQARVVAEKIRASVQAPYQLKVSQNGQTDTTVQHQCSASIGVVVFAGHQSSQTDIMKRADVAMYMAKDAGRDTIRISDEAD